VVSETEARAGVTGHHVRYVLAFGLAGSLIAFVVLDLYYGYDSLAQAISQKWAALNVTLVASYAVLIALAVVSAALLLGFWDMVSGRSPNTRQRIMRWRVVLQFIAICPAMAALYLSAKAEATVAIIRVGYWH
jgi:Hypoxia induced protein conserved region